MSNMLLMVKLALPADTPTLADAVVEAVRQGIVDGELTPGTTYSVYQLAELLGVSRSPVREGLLRLAEAHLVRIDRNRGFHVLLPRARDVHEIFDIRLAIEPRAAAQAAARGTDEQHGLARAALDGMLRAADRHDEAAFWPADRALHDHLLRAAGNHRAAVLIEQLRATTALLGPPTTASGRTLHEIAAEHQPVVTAVLTRDADAARTAMHDHLLRTEDLLVRRLTD